MNIMERAIRQLVSLRMDDKEPGEGELWMTAKEFRELQRLARSGQLNLILRPTPSLAGLPLRISRATHLPH